MRSYENPSSVAEQHSLYFMIYAVARRLKSTADAALLTSAGLTTSQATALRIIVDSGEISPNEVAEALGQRKSAMTTMVRRLESAAFITKTNSTSDGRRVVLRPTEAGSQAVTTLVDAFSSIDETVRAAVAPGRLASLHVDLHEILEALNSMEAEAR